MRSTFCLSSSDASSSQNFLTLLSAGGKHSLIYQFVLFRAKKSSLNINVTRNYSKDILPLPKQFFFPANFSLRLISANARLVSLIQPFNSNTGDDSFTPFPSSLSPFPTCSPGNTTLLLHAILHTLESLSSPPFTVPPAIIVHHPRQEHYGQAGSRMTPLPLLPTGATEMKFVSARRRRKGPLAGKRWRRRRRLIIKPETPFALN